MSRDNEAEKEGRKERKGKESRVIREREKELRHRIARRRGISTRAFERTGKEVVFSTSAGRVHRFN